MSQQIILTEQSELELARLSEWVPGVDAAFLIETALAVTSALYEKSANGAAIRVQYLDGKAEELRFKVKKPAKKKKATDE
jgi:hypothetical protein